MANAPSVRDAFPADLIAFVQTPVRIAQRQWFEYKEGKVYVRAYPMNGATWLGLGAIEVLDKHKRRGHFNFVLTELEQIASAGKGRVSVENIQNYIVEEAVQRRGYTIKDPQNMCPTYYKDFGGMTL